GGWRAEGSPCLLRWLCSVSRRSWQAGNESNGQANQTERHKVEEQAIEVPLRKCCFRSFGYGGFDHISRRTQLGHFLSQRPVDDYRQKCCCQNHKTNPVEFLTRPYFRPRQCRRQRQHAADSLKQEIPWKNRTNGQPSQLACLIFAESRRKPIGPCRRGFSQRAEALEDQRSSNKREENRAAKPQ